MNSGASQPNPAMSMMMAQQMASQQAAANKQAAEQQQKMNMVGQSTPYGSLTYESDPNSPSGYTAKQTLSPELQGLLSSNTKMAQGSSDLGNTLMANAGGAMAKPLDLSYDANASRIADLEKQTLDPLWDQKTEGFNQQMANRGVMPGSAAYDSAYRDFNNSKNNAYNNMFLGAYNTATNNAIQQYNSPFNALASLRGGSQLQNPVSSMGLTTTPQESVQAPDVMGAYSAAQGTQQNAYNNQLQQQNATLGGLFGLGGSIAGGMMGGPFGASIGSGLGNAASFGLGLSGPFPKGNYFPASQ